MADKGTGNNTFNDKSKPQQIRFSNIAAAKSVADAVRTSLGPRGLDKMIKGADGSVTVTNDGATILKLMEVLHPAAKMLVHLSQAQDIEAGDGTTSVVVIAGALLQAAEGLLSKGIHPAAIADSFQAAAKKSCEILESIATPVTLEDRDQLIKSASTSLNSKVVSQHSDLLAPMVVDAVLRVAKKESHNVDLRDIKIIKKLGGTVDDCELVNGVVFDKRISHIASGLDRMENAKIGLIQFCLSPPKTDLDNQVIVSDYAQMDRVLKEERNYILKLCKAIKKAGCNVLLIQKSILRDAVNDLALHFLSKMKILVVRDIEREDVEFVCRSLGCKPIASIDHFKPENLAQAQLVEEISAGGSKLLKVTGSVTKPETVTIFVRAVNEMILEEADRSIHDALCVVRCLVKKRFLIAGGGAPEIELALQLSKYAKELVGPEAYCFSAFAEALEVVPFTLAENAGLNPISTVTELRARHKDGQITAGINVRKGKITDILEENVVQPLLVSTSAITLAAETVRSLMKIDDIINVR